MACSPHTLLILSSGLSGAMLVVSAVPSQNPSVASTTFISLAASPPVSSTLLSLPLAISTAPLPLLLSMVTAVTPMAARYTSTHPNHDNYLCFCIPGHHFLSRGSEVIESASDSVAKVFIWTIASLLVKHS